MIKIIFKLNTINIVDLPLFTIANLSSGSRRLCIRHFNSHSFDTTGTPHLTEALYLVPSGVGQMR